MRGAKSGTIVLTLHSKDKVVFAADSRIKITGSMVYLRNDACKVRAVSKKFIFASSGLNGYEHVLGNGATWDGYSAAAQLVDTVPKNSPNPIKSLATLWGEWMEKHIDEELTKNPEPILRDKKTDVLTYAMFTGPAGQGELVTYSVQLLCACSGRQKRAVLNVTPASPNESVPLGVSMGRFGSEEGTETADELLLRKSDRARQELAGWKTQLAGMSRAEWEGAMTVWATNFVLKNTNSRDLGGPVDAVEMSSNGQIRWIQRKSNCPEEL